MPLPRSRPHSSWHAFGGQLRLRPIDATLDQLKVPGIIVRSISPMDPTGWVTVNLERDASVPIPPVNPPKVQGPPARPRPPREGHAGADCWSALDGLLTSVRLKPNLLDAADLARRQEKANTETCGAVAHVAQSNAMLQCLWKFQKRGRSGACGAANAMRSALCNVSECGSSGWSSGIASVREGLHFSIKMRFRYVPAECPRQSQASADRFPPSVHVDRSGRLGGIAGEFELDRIDRNAAARRW